MLLAIVPAHNEEKNIGSVVRNLFGHPASLGSCAGQIVDKVVVVDDGSTDNTAVIAREAGAVVLLHKINRGQGAALQTGHDYALNCGADYVLHFDGDSQFDVSDIKPALEEIQRKNVDVLLGSRFLGKEANIPAFKKNIIFPVARVFNRVFGGIDLTDVDNGFCILNRRALESVKITHDRMAHATEIIEQIKKHNLKHIEFPVRVVYREYGQGVEGGFVILKDLILGRFIKKHW